MRTLDPSTLIIYEASINPQDHGALARIPLLYCEDSVLQKCIHK